MITRQNDVLGSIFFDEHSYGNDEVVLEFFTVNFQERNSKKFPQRPLPQSYHIEYPLLAYKNFTPDNKEVCIINLCTYTNKIIDLGEFEFQSFVTHTQKVDQKLFNRKEETSTSIMLLAERLGVTHLMCIRGKPYEPGHEEHVFVFNGVLPDP